MTGIKMDMEVAIVIHTEEEFDWQSGFHRHNTHITHTPQLKSICDALLKKGMKVTLAVDNSFLDDEHGLSLLQSYRDQVDQVELAAHLHPWVTPPYTDMELKEGPLDESQTYPGNLSFEQENSKLEYLKSALETISSSNVVSYLAGRYGIGANTPKILENLGFKVDLSISPYFNTEFQQQLSFVPLDRNTMSQNAGVNFVPHSSGCVANFSLVANILNSSPRLYKALSMSIVGRLLFRALGVKRVRLTPEGVTLKDLKKLTNSLAQTGSKHLVLSFHSPSLIAGKTPYVESEDDVKELVDTLFDYVSWLKNRYQVTPLLARDWELR